MSRRFRPLELPLLRPGMAEWWTERLGPIWLGEADEGRVVRLSERFCVVCCVMSSSSLSGEFSKKGAGEIGR